MDVLQLIAENKIKEALSEGVFDNLEGYGKPINLETVDSENDENFMANHILSSNRFLPVWLEDRKKLQQEISILLDNIKGEDYPSSEKLSAIEQLNRRISGYNLRVPVDSLRLLAVALPGK
jgi:hypothetical protein